MSGRWWRRSVGYEVYIRSFADSDGDGVGDLPGVLDRLEYLAWLGVDVVWITPFYPSPMLDHGYDVADYLNVAEVFGSLTDLDAVLKRAHSLGLRVLIDLVPNHTSSAHPWFAAARSSRDDPRRDWYIWRDPAPDGGPPNNWRGQFGGPAWTLDEATAQYWLHLFLPDQPDLNWANPQVLAEFDCILRFWLERGVDGFRIDVAHSLVKHPELIDNPEGQRLHDIDQPGVHRIFERWRKVVAPYDGLLLGEVYLLEAERVGPYVAGEGLDLAFWFGPLHIDWTPEGVRGTLVAGAAASDGRLAWVQGSHDRPRAASRYGGGPEGRARALAMATLLMGLPGVPFIYQGEELGLSNGVVPVKRMVDPQATRTRDYDSSRDVARTPMPWAPEPGLGFTEAAEAWLPFGDRAPSDTVAVQRDDPGSTLHAYRRLVHVRRELEEFDEPGLEWLEERRPVVGYRRGRLVIAADCGGRGAAFEPGDSGPWRVLFSTQREREGARGGGAVRLDAHEAVILRG